MRTRNKIIIGIIVACLAAAAGIWMEVRRAHLMRAAVEQALEQNRNYVPFTSDTIYLSPHSSPTSTPFPSGEGRGEAISLRDAVAYYRHPLRRLWTSPNDRLRAGYALGCIYRDLHEAPIAIITWEDAVAAADTTADDCDYATLYRVYGQMADMYMWQHLPEKELECRKNYCKYSIQAKDTLESLHGSLLCNSAYYALRDTAAIFANSETVRQQYLKLGLAKEAATVYPTPIQIAVETGQFERARVMMDEYEHNSELFGEDGFIKDSTRAQYHSYKGHYYLGIHEIDSAERQFRFILQTNSTAISAYRGLIGVYREKRDIDSVQKYSTLFEAQAVDLMDKSKNTAIIQAEGMYDFSRQQKKAQNEEKKADRRKLELIVSAMAIVTLIIISIFFNKKERLQKRVLELEYNKLEDDYSVALKQLEETQNDVAILQQETIKNKVTKDLLQKKEGQVIELNKLVNELSKRLKYSPRHKLQSDIKETEIVEQFHLICKSHFEEDKNGFKSIPPRKASDHEWELLSQHTRIAHPTFYLFINEHRLSDLEFKVCLLVRYGFKNPEIAILTASNKRGISNVRKSIAEDLFGLDSALGLDDQLSQI